MGSQVDIKPLEDEVPLDEEADELHLLLLGKTGEGKSTTGNTLLGREVFHTSSDTMSDTRLVCGGFSRYGNLELMVVDGPGLQEASQATQEEIDDKAAENMGATLALCYGGVDAFLLVFKYGGRFKDEDILALQSLEKVFGPTFKEHMLLIITCGDHFEDDRRREPACDLSFENWCERQKGGFRDLYRACDGRCFLFNNREKDMSKKETLTLSVLKMARELKGSLGRYTNGLFEEFDFQRKQFIVEKIVPILEKKIQRKVSHVQKLMSKMCAGLTKDGEDNLKKEIGELKSEIQNQDERFEKVFDTLLSKVKEVESNLQNVLKLRSLQEEIEDIRRSQYKWNEWAEQFRILMLKTVVGIPVAAGNKIVNIARDMKVDTEIKKREDEQTRLWRLLRANVKQGRISAIRGPGLRLQKVTVSTSMNSQVT